MNPRPLEKIDALTDEQRQQLADWLLTETLDKARELAKQEFDTDIPRSTLHRFRKRCEASDYLDTSEESPRARAELLNAAASGKPNFCQATIALLEKQVFELAHGLHDEGILDALKNLFGLINHHKNTAVRERLAAVQERKAQLREEELALKKTTRAANSDFSPRPSDLLSDDLGPLATTLDEIEARATKKFCLPPLPPNHNHTPAQNPLSDAHDSGGATTESQTPVGANATESSSEPSSKTLSESSSVPCVPSVLSVPSTAAASSQCQMKNAQFSMLNEKTSSVPSGLSGEDSSAVNTDSLESRVSAYTLARHQEATHGKNPLIVGKYAAWNFKSKMQWCPCGNKYLPCPDHGDFPSYFWQLSPDSTDYLALLRSKNLTFTSPYQLLREQERNAKRLAAEKSAIVSPSVTGQSAIRDPHSAIVSHALRRWIAYTPFRPGMPPRDQSWHEECPCGAKLPCDHHDDLWIEVHYMKPWDPAYAAALARHGIPFHRPTDEELQAAPSAPSSSPVSETLSETLSKSLSEPLSKSLSEPLSTSSHEDIEDSRTNNGLQSDALITDQPLSLTLPNALSGSIVEDVENGWDDQQGRKQ